MTRALALLLSLVMPVEAAAITAAQLMEAARAGAEESTEHADIAMKELNDLAQAEGAAEFGFMTDAERATSTRGPAMPILIARLDAMKSYNVESGADILELLVFSKRVFYPVLVPGRPPHDPPRVIRSGFEVLERDQEWITASLGGTNFANMVQTTLKTIGRSPDQVAIVEIPSLRLHFIGFVEGEALKLASIVDAPAFDIPAGVARDARVILRHLLPWARDHNGAPV